MWESLEKTTLIVMAALISVGLHGCVENIEVKRKVVVFVLDDFSDDGSHGYLVSNIIRKECNCPIIKKDIFTKAIKGGNEYFKGLMEILTYAERHPDEGIVVNLSLGSYDYNLAEHLIIKRLYHKGAVIVAAAGNDNTLRKQYPAGYEEVVAVAAIDSNGRKEEYSNFGSYVDLAAEGHGHTKIINIETELRGVYIQEKITYLIRGGTSFATPRVTALFTNILQRRPELSNVEVAKLVKNTADSIAHFSRKSIDMIKLNRINPIRALCTADPEYKRRYQLRHRILNVGLTMIILFTSGLLIYIPFGMNRAIRRDKEERRKRLEELERLAREKEKFRSNKSVSSRDIEIFFPRPGDQLRNPWGTRF